jgi:hypothetical protein
MWRATTRQPQNQYRTISKAVPCPASLIILDAVSVQYYCTMETVMADAPKHLVVRIKMTGEPLETVIKKHNAVAVSGGSVWFVKRGQPLKDSRAALFTRQIEQSIPTFLYVAQLKAKTIQAFQSPILAIAHAVPSEEAHLIPPYYASFGSDVKTAIWLKVGQFKEVPNASFRLLQIESTKSPVAFVLSRSMASILTVIQGKVEAAPPR